MRKENLKIEILRGLLEGEAYGYEIAKRFKEERGRVHTGYLYAVLRELEEERLVQGEWRKGEAGPPRKIYRITTAGKESLELGLIQKAKKDYPRFPQIRTAAAIAIVALVLADLVQYIVGGSLLEISIPAGVAVLIFASTIAFVSLKKSGTLTRWVVSSIVFLIAISIIFPPHPSHTWQGFFGFILVVLGVVKLSVGLALLGFSLLLGSFVIHEIAERIDPGPLHDVYTSSTWLAMFAAGIGVNAFYLYLVRGRIVSLGELLSFRRSPALGGRIGAEESRVLKAPRQLVWKILTDMENWPRWLNDENGFRVLSHNIVSVEGNVIIADEVSEVIGRRISSRDKYTLFPEEKIEETFIEGPIRGRIVFTIRETAGGTKVGMLAEAKFRGAAKLSSWLWGHKTQREIQAGFLKALAKATENPNR